MTRRTPSSIVARLTLALFATLLPLIPCEIWARYDFERRNARFEDLPADRAVNPANLKMADIIRPSRHEGVVYELRPGLQGTFIGAPYSANSHGMRDRELPLEKPADEYRIALIGDSLAFGWGVPVEHSMGEVMERALNAEPRPVGAKRIEVLNFAVPGYNSAQEAAVLEHRALAFDPDLILVQYYYNDQYLPGFLLERPEKPWFCFGAWLAARLSNDGQETPALLEPSRVGEANDSVVAEWRKDEARVPPQYRYMVGPTGVRRAFERFRDVAARRAVPIVVYEISIPTQRRIDGTDAVDLDTIADPEFASIVGGVGFPCIGTDGFLVGELRARKAPILSLVLSPADWHFNIPGNRLLGEHLARQLRRHLKD